MKIVDRGSPASNPLLGSGGSEGYRLVIDPPRGTPSGAAAVIVPGEWGSKPPSSHLKVVIFIGNLF
jgi:hypothetical protein